MVHRFRSAGLQRCVKSSRIASSTRAAARWGAARRRPPAAGCEGGMERWCIASGVQGCSAVSSRIASSTSSSSMGGCAPWASSCGGCAWAGWCSNCGCRDASRWLHQAAFCKLVAINVAQVWEQQLKGGRGLRVLVKLGQTWSNVHPWPECHERQAPPPPLHPFSFCKPSQAGYLVVRRAPQAGFEVQSLWFRSWIWVEG